MKRLPRRAFALSIVVLSVVLFFALNIAAGVWLRTARIDLTEHGLYTLSPGTRAILSSLKEPITLRFYFSRDVATNYASVNAYAQRVRDLLQEYVAAAHGKILLEEIDPEPFTPEEDEATAQGLTGAPTQEGENLYFGLVGTNTVDGREVIAYFSQDREPYLEYDLTSAVYRLSQAEKPVLGIIAGVPLQQGQPGVAGLLGGNDKRLVLYEQLRKNFFAEPLSLSIDKIPDDINTLIILHPAGLTQTTMYAVDQFVMRGGHVIAFVDPYSEMANYTPTASGVPIPTQSDLAPLFKAWGVDYDDTKVVANLDRAIRVQMRGPPGTASPVVDYIAWLRLQDGDFNAHDPVTGSLNQVNMASAGALAPAKGATTSFTPLIETTPDSELLDASVVRATRDPTVLTREFVSANKRYVLAARIQGPAKTAFPDGPPENDTKLPAGVTPAPPPPQIKQNKDINVIVVADSDLFDDRFWVQTQNVLGTNVMVPTADNGAFVQNAVENMLGSNDLISLRTREPEVRPFTVVDNLRRAAEGQYLNEEKQLQDQVTQTETRLRQLEGQAPDQTANGAEASTSTEVLSPNSQAEIEKFRRELIETRARLREVQANLRKDVEALGTRLAFLNIALVPILVALAAFVLAILRRRRRAQARGLT